MTELFLRENTVMQPSAVQSSGGCWYPYQDLLNLLEYFIHLIHIQVV